MLTCCWSVKGGVGTSVVAAGLALETARTHPPVLLVDLGGDQAGVLGVHPPATDHLDAWVAGATDVPVDALCSLGVEVGGVRLVTGGRPGLAPDRIEVGAERLRSSASRVVVDAGRVDGPGADVARLLAGRADRSLCVLRPCYLAAARAARSPVPVTEVVLVDEPGRALSRRDLRTALAADIAAVVPWDPAVARSVDAGLLASRRPRGLARALGALA